MDILYKVADKLRTSRKLRTLRSFPIFRYILWYTMCCINHTIYTFMYLFDLLCGRKPILIRAWVVVLLGRIKPNNWGDELNYYMIKELTGRKVYIHNKLLRPFRKVKSNLFIGSVFEMYNLPNCIVWGTGVMHANSKLVNKPARVLAVRGSLTKEWLNKNGVDCPPVFGDPALLLPLIVEVPRQARVKIGLIPHWSDLKNPVFLKIVEFLGQDAIVINLTDYKDWRDIIKQVNQCQTIISSSLHGLIVSDAYQVPNVWAQFARQIEGDDTKYLDYFSSVSRETRKPLWLDGYVVADELCDYIKSNWKPIEIDLRPLINACPFLTPDQKKYYISKGHTPLIESH